MSPQPEPAPDEPKQAPSRITPRQALQLVALLIGVYLIASGVYGLWKGGNPPAGGGQQAGAPPTQSCKPGRETQTALKAASIGEVAGFSANADAMPFSNLSFKAPDGTGRSFSDFRGKVILVNLWATWCAPCRKEMPSLDALQKAKGNKDFEVVAVNVDTRDPERPGLFLDEIGVTTLTRYADSSGAFLQDMKKANRAPGLPSTLLFDRQGCELGFILGPADWGGKDALALIDVALGKAP
jgi:thiol-disulfide isomerase/thioredoxin